jgi:bifunctional non-homologous end joining protein LigD
LEGLLGLVDIGAVELHPWNARVDDIERADMLVVDLDPGKDVPWDAVIEAALAMRELLEVQGLETWPKLTGGKGLHLMAPLAQTMPHDQAHALARRLVVALADKNPRRYTVSAQAKRDGRIFWTTCATDVARQLSVLGRRGCGQAFRSPNRLAGRRSSAGLRRTLSQ